MPSRVFFSKLDLHFCLRSWIFGDFWEEKEDDSFVLYNHESGTFIGVLSKDGYNYWGNKNGRLSEQGSQKGEVSQDQEETYVKVDLICSVQRQDMVRKQRKCELWCQTDLG